MIRLSERGKFRTSIPNLLQGDVIKETANCTRTPRKLNFYLTEGSGIVLLKLAINQWRDGRKSSILIWKICISIHKVEYDNRICQLPKGDDVYMKIKNHKANNYRVL